MSDTHLIIGVNRLLLFTALFFVPPAPAQIPVISSTPVKQTQVPVFTGFEAAEQDQTIEHGVALANFRLHLDYRLPNPGSKLALRLHPQRTLELKADGAGKWQTLDLQYEQLRGEPATFSAAVNGTRITEGEVIGAAVEEVSELQKVRLDRDFTAMVRFMAKGDGALFSRCRTEEWEPHAKMLGLRGGKLFYDIGWLGVLTGGTSKLSDGKPHVAVVRSTEGTVSLFVDGKGDGVRKGHTRPDAKGHTFHVGSVQRHLGLRISGVRVTVRAELADAALARRLDYSVGAAVLVSEMVYLDDAGQPAEFTVARHRGDAYSLSYAFSAG